MPTANLDLSDAALSATVEALRHMDMVAPTDWGTFVPCKQCNAVRQTPCQTLDGPARKMHAVRYLAGLTLHSTLYLLTRYPGDVIGEDA